MKKGFPLLGLIPIFIWSGNFIAVKTASMQADDFLILIIRMGLIIATIIPFFPRPPLPLKRLAKLSFFFVVPLYLMIYGLGLDFPASMGAVIYQLSIPLVMILSMIFLKERPSWVNFLGTGIAILGVYLMYDSPAIVADPMGYVAFIISAVFWAFYCIEIKTLPKVSLIAAMGWFYLLAFPIIALIYLARDPMIYTQLFSVKASFWAGLLYMTFMSSLVAHFFWMKTLSLYPASKTAPLTLLVPPISAIIEYLVLGTFLPGSALFYMALIILGVGLSELKLNRKSS